MSERDDLLGKADAFLKRYHPTSTAGQHDVPVLTEVVADPREPPAAPPSGAPAEAPLSRAELLELEQRLMQTLLDAVKAHVAQAVEEQIKGRVKTDLEALARETVARAVATEIARLRGPSRGA